MNMIQINITATEPVPKLVGKGQRQGHPASSFAFFSNNVKELTG